MTSGDPYVVLGLDGVPLWRVYFEIIIPMLKLTFVTSILLLSIGVVKAYDIIVAMTNGAGEH